MRRAQKLRAPTTLQKDAHNRTNATYRSRQLAVDPTSSNKTGVFYLIIVRCTIHTPTVQCITLRCVQSTELPQHHKYYSYVVARQLQIDSSAIQNIQSDVLPQLSRYTWPLSRTPPSCYDNPFPPFRRYGYCSSCPRFTRRHFRLPR